MHKLAIYFIVLIIRGDGIYLTDECTKLLPRQCSSLRICIAEMDIKARMKLLVLPYRKAR